MCPWIAGTMSSQKFSEIQSHSMSLGSSSEERSWRRRARLATRGGLGAGERLYGVYAQQPLFAALLHHALRGAGTDDLRQRVPHRQLFAYAGKAFCVAVCRREIHVADAHEREPLEDPVGTDEGGDELGVRAREDVLRRVVLGEESALLEDGDLVAHLYGLVYVVGDEDDGLLDVLLDAQELVLEPLARDRVHSPEGLVHEHDRGVGRHRARAHLCAASPSQGGSARWRCSRRWCGGGRGLSAGWRSRSCASAACRSSLCSARRL